MRSDLRCSFHGECPNCGNLTWKTSKTQVLYDEYNDMYVSRYRICTECHTKVKTKQILGYDEKIISVAKKNHTTKPKVVLNLNFNKKPNIKVFDNKTGNLIKEEKDWTMEDSINAIKQWLGEDDNG